SRTFAESVDRVWTTTRSVLKSRGWDIDKEDRQRGTIVTDSRSVDFSDFGVYGKGTRHRLMVTVHSVGAGQTSVTVQREVFKEEPTRGWGVGPPVKPSGGAVEVGILAEIGRLVPAASPPRPHPAPIPAPTPGAPPPPAEAPPVEPAPPRVAAPPAAAPPSGTPRPAVEPPAPPPPSRAQTPRQTARIPKVTYRVTGAGGAAGGAYPPPPSA